MRTNRTILSAALLVALLPSLAAAQAEPSPHQHGQAMQPSDPGPKGPSCKDMMAHHQAMQERMQAMDEELDGLVGVMRAASGDAKVEATAAAVEALVEQLESMHQMMTQHQPMMMRHMMEHMGGGGEGMSGCPMMKGMTGEAETPGEDAPAPPEDDHSAHHPE